jgi:5'-deoxynucleotidase YfbR-like HD superfamily hydrolase
MVIPSMYEMQNNNILTINMGDVQKDVDVMLWSMKLEQIKRFFHLRFWEQETIDAEYAERVESKPRLESVADHSWHLTDIVLLIGRHFPFLDINKCIKLCVLHDKIEIITGDIKPIGRDGTGNKTYAFDSSRQSGKEETEKNAVEKYISLLAPSARAEQISLLYEIVDSHTQEATFVKAVDKIQALLFILIKKQGNIHDKHLIFSLEYAKKAIAYFPQIEPYYCEIRRRLILQVANRRQQTINDVDNILASGQPSLFDE